MSGSAGGSLDEEFQGKWAYVRCRLDDVKSKVPVSFIRNFDESEVLDTSRLYKVFWSDVNGDTPEKLKCRIAGPVPLIESKEDPAYGDLGYYRATIYVVAGESYFNILCAFWRPRSFNQIFR